MSEPEIVTIVTVPAERRQIAKTLLFNSNLAPHINWDSIAQTARELGSHFEARSQHDGGITVTLFWAHDEHEK